MVRGEERERARENMQNADAFSPKVPLSSHCRQIKQTGHTHCSFTFTIKPLLKLSHLQFVSNRLGHSPQKRNVNTRLKTQQKQNRSWMHPPTFPSLNKTTPAKNTETCKKPTVVHFGVSSHQVITSFLIEPTVLPSRILLGNSPFTKPNMSPLTNHTHSPLLSFDVYINAW